MAVHEAEAAVQVGANWPHSPGAGNADGASCITLLDLIYLTDSMCTYIGNCLPTHHPVLNFKCQVDTSAAARAQQASVLLSAAPAPVSIILSSSPESCTLEATLADLSALHSLELPGLAGQGCSWQSLDHLDALRARNMSAATGLEVGPAVQGLPSPASSDLAGLELPDIPRYEVLRLLGQGTFGEWEPLRSPQLSARRHPPPLLQDVAARLPCGMQVRLPQQPPLLTRCCRRAGVRLDAY